MPEVRKGDVLIIPAPSEENKDGNKMTIHWQQSWRQRDGDYYALKALNKSQNNDKVPFFIQSDWYNFDGFNSGACRRRDDGKYEVTVDDRHVYGSKNIWGQNKFVVWHDKGRKPYADRFEEGFLSGHIKTFSEIGGSINEGFGNFVGNTVGKAAQTLEVYAGGSLGMPLKDF